MIQEEKEDDPPPRKLPEAGQPMSKELEQLYYDIWHGCDCDSDSD
jgi:hypothetical protein